MADIQAQNQQTVRKVRSRPSTTGSVVQVVYIIAGAIEIILGFRFVLKLLGANPEAGFVSFVYGISKPFIAPFEAVFKTSEASGSIFEWNALLAIVVYAVIAWGIASLISAVAPRASSQGEQVEHVETTDNG
jgi:hypothetical protein